MMVEENTTVSDNSDLEENGNPQLSGYLSKWTNYIHGWQDRFIVLKDSTLSYYKSELESNLGCRGALCLKKAKVKPHEFDDCRFDVSVNDCVWYLRANTPEEKQQWIDVLELFKVESGYGTSSDSSSNGGGLRRHDSATSLQSTGSNGRSSTLLSEKIAELETYTDLLTKQAAKLQHYYDKCEAQSTELVDEGCEAIDAVTLTECSEAGDVRATSASFRATCESALSALRAAADLIRTKQRGATHARELYLALKTQLSEGRIPSIPGPDHEVMIAEETISPITYVDPDSQEGPHSTLPDDEFYDAVETGFDKMAEEVRAPPAPHTRDEVDLPPPEIDNRLTVHPLWPEIDRVSTEQINAAFEDVGGEIGWQLFAEDGDMKMYRRELEVDGMVLDPLKAIHKVKGVSAREMCHYFFNPRYRYEWETTLEKMTIVQQVSTDAVVCHQAFKRVWPASARDALFWSHTRRAPDNVYAVINHSTIDPQYPANTGASIRLHLTVCLACRSTWPRGQAPSRDNITTHIAYCSTVNPGGWAPAGVLRAVYKREYPKFLQRFTAYVAANCATQPLAT